MSAENKAIVQRYFEEVWSKGNLAVADEILASTYVSHDPASPVATSSPGALKQRVIMYRTTFPDVQFTVEDIFADGNKVATRWKAVGTHKGPLMGMDPTGKQVTVTGVSISHIADGVITEEWVYRDSIGMLRQLGVVPQMARSGE
ncbi:ester cyclase [Candidatus Poribacteria bacterium]|nr:ester cyclase [Candidatus Poribacteria bacterium]